MGDDPRGEGALAEQRTRIVPCTVGTEERARGSSGSERARPAEEESEKKKIIIGGEMIKP